MDYCHPCRRHLNGALACPGCGAPAKPPGAYAPEAYDTPEPESESAHRSGPAEAGRRDRRGPVRSAPAASEASRRDRKAAAHRRRRRRTMLITAGFVLAAGGLGLAEIGVDAPGFSSSPNPAAAGGESSEVDGSGPSEPSASARPLDDSGVDPEASASPSPDASASPSVSKSPDASAAPTGSPSREAQSANLPGSSDPASDSTTPTGPATTPAADPTTSDPSPDPSPSETCNQFLWWCT